MIGGWTGVVPYETGKEECRDEEEEERREEDSSISGCCTVARVYAESLG